MILLDTNVVSEGMRREPDPRIIAWLDRQPASGLFLSVITVDEISYGIEILPSGRRKERLARVFSDIVSGFAGRVLTFGQDAALASASFRAGRRRAGMPMSLADSQIAGVAKSNAFALATLNVDDFQGTDLEIRVPR